MSCETQASDEGSPSKVAATGEVASKVRWQQQGYSPSYCDTIESVSLQALRGAAKGKTLERLVGFGGEGNKVPNNVRLRLAVAREAISATCRLTHRFRP